MPNFRFPFTKAKVKKIAFIASSTPNPDILWWKMSDGSGTTITADVGVNGNTNATWSNGGLQFNGTSQYARTSSNPSVSSYNIITLTFWIQTTDWNTNDQQVINYIGNEAQFDCLITGNRVNIGLFDNGQRNEQLQNASSSLSANTWYHFAIVYDNSTTSGEIKLYINAVNQTLNLGTDTKTELGNFGSNQLYVGAYSDTLFFLSGMLDDIRIYSSELSSTVITSIYNAGRQ